MLFDWETYFDDHPFLQNFMVTRILLKKHWIGTVIAIKALNLYVEFGRREAVSTYIRGQRNFRETG